MRYCTALLRCTTGWPASVENIQKANAEQTPANEIEKGVGQSEHIR
jgi:hypothetical protein